jgi:hypothetical protein
MPMGILRKLAGKDKEQNKPPLETSQVEETEAEMMCTPVQISGNGGYGGSSVCEMAKRVINGSKTSTLITAVDVSQPRISLNSSVVFRDLPIILNGVRMQDTGHKASITLEKAKVDGNRCVNIQKEFDMEYRAKFNGDLPFVYIEESSLYGGFGRPFSHIKASIIRGRRPDAAIVWIAHAGGIGLDILKENASEALSVGFSLYKAGIIDVICIVDAMKIGGSLLLKGVTGEKNDLIFQREGIIKNLIFNSEPGPSQPSDIRDSLRKMGPFCTTSFYQHEMVRKDNPDAEFTVALQRAFSTDVEMGIGCKIPGNVGSQPIEEFRNWMKDKYSLNTLNGWHTIHRTNDPVITIGCWTKADPSKYFYDARKISEPKEVDITQYLSMVDYAKSM